MTRAQRSPLRKGSGEYTVLSPTLSEFTVKLAASPPDGNPRGLREADTYYRHEGLY
jgi:hypothetical protein